MKDHAVSLPRIASECELEILSPDLPEDRLVSKVFASDLMSDVLAFTPPGVLLVTALVSKQSIVTANIAEAVGVIYTRGKRPDEDAVGLAARLGVPLMATGLSTWGICRRLQDLGLLGICNDEENAEGS